MLSLHTALIVLTVISFIAYCVSSIKFIHFFQLNSYQLKSHTTWVKRNTKKLLPNILFGILTLILAMQNNAIAVILANIIMLVSIYYVKPQKAKKPLVYTMRIKRFIATHTVLFVLIILAAHFASNAAYGALAAFTLCPFIIFVTAAINAPIEKGVKNHYINDAKKMLKSCPNLKIIGVTGSYGKTSVKYCLTSLLKTRYNVLMTPESYNTPMGVVKTIRENLSAVHEIFVCEMGARHVGDIKEICDIVNPTDGVITSVGPQHLETFKTLDNIKNTKFELADAVQNSNGGKMFLNCEDENVYTHALKKYNKLSGKNTVTYSISKDTDYKAFNITASSMGTSFTVSAPNGETEDFSTPLVGKHNVINVLGAIAVAHTFNIPLKELCIPVKRLKSVPHRLELKDGKNACIIDDAYNANPFGTKAALETLALFDGFKITVTPGMVELGDKMEECNREFGRNLSNVCDYVILVGQKQAEDILKGLRDNNYPSSKIFVADTVEQAIQKAYGINSDGRKKYILLENDLTDNYIS